MRAARIILALTIIAVISGGLLAYVNGVAEPLIRENRRRATREAVITVLPGAKEIKRVERKGTVVYQGRGANGRLIGNAFSVEKSGFQGTIRMMLGMDPSFNKVLGLAVLENVETPGLGSKIAEEFFRRRFAGISGAESINLVKNQPADKGKNEVEAISGATISSRAVVDGLNDEIQKVRRLWK